MRTQIKFAKMSGLSGDQQLLSLKDAIHFELAKPQALADIFGASFPKVLDEVRLGTRALSGVEERIKAALSLKYSTPSSNPILVDLASQFATFFHSNMPEIDMGWMSLFDLIDLRGTSHDHFDVDDTNAGVTYEQVKPGAAIKKRTAITEARTSVKYLTFGAGLGILDDWINYQKFWSIDEAVAEFRAKWYDKKAEMHYSLLTALSNAIDVAFNTDDATTFNAGAAALLRAVRSSGYATGQNASFKIVTSGEQVGRVTRMLDATRGSGLVAFGTMKQPIAYTVDEVIATTYVAANDTGYYLVLPGRKLKRGEWRDLGVEQARNAAERATDWYGSGQFNAVVGDTAQVRRIKFA